MGALKRRYAHLEELTGEHDRLISLLRSESEPSALAVLRRIRSGEQIRSIITTPQQTAAAMGQTVTGRQSSYNDRPAQRPRSRSPPMQPPPKRVPIDSLLIAPGDASRPRTLGHSGSAVHQPSQRDQGRRLSQPLQYPISQIPASQWHWNRGLRRWNSVPSGLHVRQSLLCPPSRPYNKSFTDMHVVDWGISYIREDALLRDIIASFLVWDHPTWSIFDEEAFCDGLANGGSELVNRFLLNAVIAFGSKIHRTFVPEKMTLDVERSAFEEAQRLWATEQNIAKEANIIGALVLNGYMACSGQERVPTDYMRRAVYLARQMGLFSEERRAEVYNASPGNERRSHSRSVLAWGLFGHQAYVQLTPAYRCSS
jgi:hypothetical protein